MMPQPLQSHTRLHRLHGAWVGQEHIHPSPFDPVGGAATGRAVNRSALGGLGMVQEYTQYREGSPNFEGHGVFWVDPASGEYVMTWFDSMGGAPSEFRGGFEGEALSLTARALQGFTRARYVFTGPHSYSFSMEVSGDGAEWSPFMTGEYRRVTG